MYFTVCSIFTKKLKGAHRSKVKVTQIRWMHSGVASHLTPGLEDELIRFWRSKVKKHGLLLVLPLWCSWRKTNTKWWFYFYWTTTINTLHDFLQQQKRKNLKERPWLCVWSTMWMLMRQQQLCYRNHPSFWVWIISFHICALSCRYNAADFHSPFVIPLSPRFCPHTVQGNLTSIAQSKVGERWGWTSSRASLGFRVTYKTTCLCFFCVS